MLETILTAVVALAAVWLILVGVVWINRPTREQAATFARLLPDLARLAFRLVQDPSTPARYRVVLVALGAWLLFPIDLIPDFLPVVGALDDIVLAALVLRWVGRGVGIDRVEAAWSGSPEGLAILRRALGFGSG